MRGERELLLYKVKALLLCPDFDADKDEARYFGFHLNGQLRVCPRWRWDKFDSVNFEYVNKL